MWMDLYPFTNINVLIFNVYYENCFLKLPVSTKLFSYKIKDEFKEDWTLLLNQSSFPSRICIVNYVEIACFYSSIMRSNQAVSNAHTHPKHPRAFAHLRFCFTQSSSCSYCIHNNSSNDIWILPGLGFIPLVDRTTREPRQSRSNNKNDSETRIVTCNHILVNRNLSEISMINLAVIVGNNW